MDIEKAFDTIWHDGLIYKIKTFGTPLYLIKLIRSFLTDRTFVLSLNETKSSERRIPAGVPQGSVLSPTLYSLYISDFKVSRACKVAFYADDSAIIAEGQQTKAITKRLKKGFEDSIKYYSKWKIKVNTGKTQAILFPYNKSPKRNPTTPISIGNAEIPFDDHVKYLGVILDKKLTYRKHLESAAEKATKCSRALYGLLCWRSALNPKNKLIIYKTIIRPILLYGCQVWNDSAKTNLKMLQVIQNKNLKIIFNLPMRFSTLELHTIHEQQLISDVIEQQNRTFIDKCRNSVYELIQELSN